MMNFISISLTTGAIILGLMTLLWLLSLALKNASIVDIFWGTGFVISAWAVFLMTPQGFLGRKLLLCLLVTVWGLRLSLHILRRNWGKPEDFRYQAWRKAAGAAWWWRSFFKVFLLQGVLLWIIATPLVWAQVSATPEHLTWLDICAIPVWMIGFFFEAAGDWQLSRFKADPANQGKVLQHGRVALHAPPQLLRRCGAVVGVLPDRPGSRRLVDDLQPIAHDHPADARLGRHAAGKDAEGRKAGLQRIYREHQRVHPLVPQTKEQGIGWITQ